MRVRSLAAAGLLLLLAALLALPMQAQAQTVTTVPDDWALIPTGLSAGEQFRLIFLSTTKRDATDDGGAAISSYKIEVSSNGGTNWSDLEDDTASTDTNLPPHRPISRQHPPLPRLRHQLRRHRRRLQRRRRHHPGRRRFRQQHRAACGR